MGTTNGMSDQARNERGGERIPVPFLENWKKIARILGRNAMTLAIYD